MPRRTCNAAKYNRKSLAITGTPQSPRTAITLVSCTSTISILPALYSIRRNTILRINSDIHNQYPPCAVNWRYSIAVPQLLKTFPKTSDRIPDSNDQIPNLTSIYHIFDFSLIVYLCGVRNWRYNVLPIERDLIAIQCNVITWSLQIQSEKQKLNFSTKVQKIIQKLKSSQKPEKTD